MLSTSNYSPAILILNSPNVDQKIKYTLSTQEITKLGRSPDCNIVLDNNEYVTVSRFHAQIQLIEDPNTGEFVWQVSDNGTTNGTLVNDKKITNSLILKSGDRITLGWKGPEFIFECQTLNPTVFIPIPEEEKETLSDSDTPVSENNVSDNIDSPKTENTTMSANEGITELPLTEVNGDGVTPKNISTSEENQISEVTPKKEEFKPLKEEKTKKPLRESKVRETQNLSRQNKPKETEIAETKTVTNSVSISNENKEDTPVAGISEITPKTTTSVKNPPLITSKFVNNSFVSSFDTNRSLWNLINFQEIAQLTGHSDEIKGLALSADSKMLVSSSADKTIKIWSLENYQEITTLTGHKLPINAVNFSNDGKLLASGSADKTIKIWSLENYQEITTLTGHKLPINAVNFSNDGKLLASGSADKTIKIWSLENYQEIATLMGHKSAINALSFSSDNQILASGGADKIIKLWEINKQGEIASFNLNLKSAINAVLFSPNQDIIAYSSLDKIIGLLNTTNGEELLRFAQPSWCLNTIAFNGQIFASNSEDNIIKIWQP